MAVYKYTARWFFNSKQFSAVLTFLYCICNLVSNGRVQTTNVNADLYIE